MSGTIKYRFLVRGGEAAAVEALNEVPLERELIIETDTLRMKLGDGVTAYNDLPYLTAESPFTAPGDIIYADSDQEPTPLGIGAEGDVMKVVDGMPAWVPPPPSAVPGQIGFGISNASAAITAGVKRILRITEETVIVGWVLSADVAGNAIVDLWASSSYPPTAGDSITGGAPPTLTAQDAAAGLPTGWTEVLPAGSWLAFYIPPGASVARLDLTLQTTRTP